MLSGMRVVRAVMFSTLMPKAHDYFPVVFEKYWLNMSGLRESRKAELGLGSLSIDV